MMTPLFSNKDLRKLILPLMAEQILAGLMGIADTLMVSNVSPAAISGVSLVDTISNIMICLFSAMATGGTIVCSQYIGLEQKKNARKAGEQVILTALAIALVFAAICVLLRVPLLRLIYGEVEADVMEAAVTYLLITGLSYPFLAISQGGAALFRAEGRTKPPMYVALGANMLNIAGNAILIFVFDMGVLGAALSTLASRAVGAIILLILLRNPAYTLRFADYAQIRPDWAMVKRVLRIGIPTGLENAFFNLGKLIVASTVSTLGTVAIASQAMAAMLDNIQGLPSNAVNIALLSVAGRCMGAGRIDETKSNTKKLCYLAGGLLIVMCGIMIPLLNPIFRLAAMTEESAELTYKICLFIFINKIFMFVPSFTLPNTLRAAGDVRYATVVSTVSMWLFRVVMSTVLCRYMNVGLFGIWYAWITDWFIRSVFYLARYRSGKWQTKKVIA